MLVFVDLVCFDGLGASPFLFREFLRIQAIVWVIRRWVFVRMGHF
jgi:hypothetical protein